MQSLKGKNALITGGGKGLGKAVALALAAEGVNLALVSRTLTDLEAVAEEAKKVNSTIKVVVAIADIAVVSAYTFLLAVIDFAAVTAHATNAADANCQAKYTP